MEKAYDNFGNEGIHCVEQLRFKLATERQVMLNQGENQSSAN